MRITAFLFDSRWASWARQLSCVSCTVLAVFLAISTADATETPATLTEQLAIEKAKEYYDTQGEWAGKFTITKVHQVRFEISNPQKAVAHIRYQAAFLLDMSKTVEDQRTFGFSYNEGWQVDWMGGHKSATF